MRNLAVAGDTVTISAADPLNLVGIIVPGERVAAISGKYVSFRDGIPFPAAERLTSTQAREDWTEHPSEAAAQ
jgi:ATP-dependent Lhr-like helicase